MLIFRYLTAEVFKSQVAVFLTLMTIFISQKFVVILGDASEGSIPAKLVLSMVALKLPQLASLILPLSIFLGIILAYSRVYADSEMTVLKACGVSEWYVVRITLISSTALAILAGAMTLYLAPWASEKEYQLKERAQADAGLSALRAGRFQETGNEKAVVFIHDMDDGGRVLNKVFVAQLPRGEGQQQSQVVYAEQGQVIERDNGEQQLILRQGQRYETQAWALNMQHTEFDSYQVQIREQAIEHQRRKLEAVPTAKLLEQDSNEAISQFQWRLAIPLSIPLLTLIAVPLSVVNPRQGKFAKLVPAISLYLGYFILLNAAKFALEDGKIPPSIGLWWVHLSALFIGAFLIIKGRPLGVWLRSILTKREAAV
ncbi:LPS export ABC transporter permease LptF [Pseudoalteromonas ruthenica]|uniref:Lipopolysaccharide export system permease protein LptF n=1 Tax=Pseudoalteromonas ruthenica TaxID=151081 RepID=A0A0F4PM69_9GAMM|nr:LPS export ABC transporter permease LptF [Pseudoalteromonas ruthenica]KJY96507.1 permease [Pseudoalteromonas ruthenica]KJY98378.1 permease [Pseudoalteromonas ruthenica]TMO93993.1 LPS export ABC transporter permease LptF [Pseudoalteromonas ruthenica]TMO98237.1 LPS export ABC transporter permease LptF [Pseudoalteromonas ruthenica]TMP04595.1 LPS export ABC transporter permease LptF [Pseudoalteromonas ruthenica]